VGSPDLGSEAGFS